METGVLAYALAPHNRRPLQPSTVTTQRHSNTARPYRLQCICMLPYTAAGRDCQMQYWHALCELGTLVKKVDVSAGNGRPHNALRLCMLWFFNMQAVVFILNLLNFGLVLVFWILRQLSFLFINSRQKWEGNSARACKQQWRNYGRQWR